jgi:hypothetical protein
VPIRSPYQAAASGLVKSMMPLGFGSPAGIVGA